MSIVLNFILNNCNRNYLEGYDSYEEFVSHQTECVNELQKDMVNFYTELITRIGNSEIDFYDLGDDDRYRTPIKYFYFSKINSNKLVLVGGDDIEQPDKTNNAFYEKLSNICENDQIVVKSSHSGGEWDFLAYYGRNYQTGNFDVVIPK